MFNSFYLFKDLGDGTIKDKVNFNNSRYFESTLELSGNGYRVATLSKLSLTLRGIQKPSLKLILTMTIIIYLM